MSGVAATRKNISKDCSSLIHEMRAAFEVISKMTANKYGNGSINLFDTFELFQEENPGTSNWYFNTRVANGETTIQGHIEPADEFANRQRFEAEDLKLILLEAGGIKLRLDSGNLYIATLTLYFAFNNHPDNLFEGNNDECSEDAEGRIGLLNDSF